MKSNPSTWDERIARLRLHYFKDISPYSIFSKGAYIAPHGNKYSQEYLEELSNAEFEALLKKESV